MNGDRHDARSSLRALVTFIIPLALVGMPCLALLCGCRQEARPGWEFMPDMAHSVPYDSFQPNPVTRDGKTLQAPVAGTIARGTLPYHYENTPEEAERAGRELQNPFQPTPANLARGKAVYLTFCQVCHGDTGKGDGPIIPKFPNPPAYTSDRLLAMREGQMFHTVTRGTSIMPSYSTQISADDRWKVVLYVQQLRSAARRPPS